MKQYLPFIHQNLKFYVFNTIFAFDPDIQNIDLTSKWSHQWSDKALLTLNPNSCRM